MDDIDYWKLCDELTVEQAVPLILGVNPTECDSAHRPKAYEAVETALINAIQGDRLPAIVHEGRDDFGNTVGPLWVDAKISVDDLRTWLKSRGIETGFFFPLPGGPDYLSDFHGHYSPKLAAAIKAWTAVSTDEELRRGKSVKQALMIWLRQHANEFGLTKEDGNPNDQGIEEVAKVANWDTRGGAPKTPGNE